MWPKLVFKQQAIASLQLCIHKIQPMRLPHLGHVIKIDYQNLRFPIALRITWPKCVNVVGQKFCVFSKTTNLFCLKRYASDSLKLCIHKFQPMRLPYLDHVMKIDQSASSNFVICLIIEISVFSPSWKSRDSNTAIWLVKFLVFFQNNEFLLFTSDKRTIH